MNFVSATTDATKAIVTTPETKAKEATYERAGKKIPWEIHPVGFGRLEYAKKAVEILDDNGFVVVAPQGTRQPHLSEFESDPIGFLLRLSRKVDNVAVCAMGLQLNGATDYAKARGFNPGKTYTATVGYVGTREDVMAQAQVHHWSVDRLVLYHMDSVAPDAYRALDNRGKLVFPTNEQE